MSPAIELSERSDNFQQSVDIQNEKHEKNFVFVRNIFLFTGNFLGIFKSILMWTIPRSDESDAAPIAYNKHQVVYWQSTHNSGERAYFSYQRWVKEYLRFIV